MRREILLTFGVFLCFSPTAGKGEGIILLDGKAYTPDGFRGLAHSKVLINDSNRNQIPERSDRDQIFAKVEGLEKKIASFDELERDLLFVRARRDSLKLLGEQYPQMRRRMLSILKKEIASLRTNAQ